MFVLLPAMVCAQAPPPAAKTEPVSKPAEAAAARLPVKRVVLYKNGVGYFEHTGRVRGNQEVTIDFTTAQLNDVLKSLTVLDLGKGRITGVSYNSIAPLEQRLNMLRLPLGAETNLTQFLSALRGTRIEVRSGTATALGRLLSVEEKQIKRKDETVETVLQVSLVTDAGEVRNFDVTPATSIRIAERDLNQEVGRYLNLLASARAQDLRRMNVVTAGAGEREIFVSYISEVPVWKSTYRIVLPAKAGAKPFLQGWAIVDNTVGEDWKDVELSLVAGAPQSFVQNISQPMYTRRPVVPLPQSAMLTPQTYEATLETDKVVTHRLEEQAGVVGGVPGGAAGGVVGGIVSSAPAKSMVLRGLPPSDRETMDMAIAEARADMESAAQARELGDLFEYKLKEAVTIRKNESALVPIAQAEIEAEKVSVWNESSGPRPRRALWMTNSSGLTLDGGSFNVIENEAFAGEGLIEPIKPGEKRLLSYAADLGVIVESKRESEQQRVSRVRIVRGVMTQTTEMRERRTYIVRNEDTTARTLVIEHPARPGWKLAADGPKPEESTVSYHRFRMTVEPKKTAELTVNEQMPISQRYELTNLTSDQITLFLQRKTITPELEQALRSIVAKKAEMALLQAQIDSRHQQVQNIFEDQQRVRENMKALKGSAEEKSLLQRYTKQLNDQEDQVQSLRQEISGLEKRRDQAKAELDRMVQDMTLDVNL
jgi:hypothetical protein